MDKIQRWKILGNILFNQDKNVFIKEMNGDLHFCKILLISNNIIKIKNFGPSQRKDIVNEIYWVQIVEFDEYKEKFKEDQK